MIDERKSERQAPRVQFGNTICDDATRHLVQRGCSGKERRRMAIVAETEKNQIVLINWLTTPGGDGVQLVFVLLRCDLRINFAAHTHDRFFRDGSRHKKIFARHSEVALRITRRNATLVSEGETDRLPRKIMRLRCYSGVNRGWCVPA